MIAWCVSRYGAFAGAIRRADVSAQTSGAKVLENLASIAVLDQLLLRNSADLRFVFLFIALCPLALYNTPAHDT